MNDSKRTGPNSGSGTSSSEFNQSLKPWSLGVRVVIYWGLRDEVKRTVFVRLLSPVEVRLLLKTDDLYTMEVDGAMSLVQVTYFIVCYT